MTGSADGSLARDLALLERAPPACRGRQRAVVVVGGVALVAYLVTKRPGDVSNPDAAVPRAEAAGAEDGRLAALRPRPRADALPAGQAPRPAVPLALRGASRRASCSSSSRSSSRARIYFMDKDGTFYALSADNGQGRVEAQDRVPERVVARLLPTAGCSRSTSSPSRRWRSSRTSTGARCSGATRCRAAASPRRSSTAGKVIFGCESGDIFALDEKTRQDEVDGAHRAARSRAPWRTTTAPSSPTTTRARSTRSTPGTAT